MSQCLEVCRYTCVRDRVLSDVSSLRHDVVSFLQGSWCTSEQASGGLCWLWRWCCWYSSNIETKKSAKPLVKKQTHWTVFLSYQHFHFQINTLKLIDKLFKIKDNRGFLVCAILYFSKNWWRKETPTINTHARTHAHTHTQTHTHTHTHTQTRKPYFLFSWGGMVELFEFQPDLGLHSLHVLLVSAWEQPSWRCCYFLAK